MRDFKRSRVPDRLEIPGLYPRRSRIPNWPVWLWLVVVIVAAIPLAGVPGVVLAHYTTSNPDFCLTCHGTGDTPDRGVPSAVHPGQDQVSCVDCHAKPGQIVFEGYVKGFMAEPERVSGNCVRCHATMTERTDQSGFKFNPRGIAINHQNHIQRGTGCVACHSNVAHDGTEERTNRPAMESCYSCHPRNDSCVKCHATGIPAPAAGRETVGRRQVAPPQATPQAVTTPSQATPPQPAATPSQATVVSAIVTGTAVRVIATPAPALPAPDTKALEEGKALFAATCAGCHGPGGSSLPGANLASKGYLEGAGAGSIARSTAEGKGGMPAFGVARGGSLSEQQVKAIVDYLFSAAR